MSKDIKSIKRALKSGEYDGADLMKAWCALENQERRISELEKAADALLWECLSNKDVQDSKAWRDLERLVG